MLSKKQIGTLKAIIKCSRTFKDVQKTLRLKEPNIYTYFQNMNPEGRGIKRKDVFDYLNPKANKVCEHCGKETKFGANNVFGYARFCSKKCSNSFNTENGVFAKAIKRKYGVDNISKSQLAKDKKKETCLKNHGVEHPQQSKAIRKKTEASVQRRFGVTNVSLNPKVKKKREATSLRRYGVKNAMHNADVFERAQHNAHRVKKITVAGHTFNVMGYEGRFIKHLIEKDGIDPSKISTRAKDMPEIYYTDGTKQKKYTPDVTFKHKSKTWVVEVKSTFTGGLLGTNRHTFRILKNKARAACKVCNFAVVFLPEKGEHIKIYRNFSDFNRRKIREEVLSCFSR